MNYQCPFCNEWICDWLHCCEGKHTSEWMEATYNTMGWSEDTICKCWNDDVIEVKDV